MDNYKNLFLKNQFFYIFKIYFTFPTEVTHKVFVFLAEGYKVFVFLTEGYKVFVFVDAP